MNAAHNLFLLMFHLSQLHNFKKIIEIFIGGVSDIFKNVEFIIKKVAGNYWKIINIEV